MDEKSMRAAIELHRTVRLNKWGGVAEDGQDVKWIRCNECRESVGEEGCRTWQVANS